MSQVLENLLKQDPDYSESKFKSKVENEFVQIKLSMVTGKTEKIKHFVDEGVYNKIQEKVQNDIKNNRIQLYDELNVANVQIVRINELEDRFEIEVRVLSKALDYYIDRQTRQHISGDMNDRVEKYSNIIFSKRKNAKDMKTSRQCPTCGANVDVNINGKCMYCGSTFDLQNYDWVITSMEI